MYAWNKYFSALQCTDIEKDDQTTIQITTEIYFGLSEIIPVVCSQKHPQTIHIKSIYNNTKAPLFFKNSGIFKASNGNKNKKLAATKDNIKGICDVLGYQHSRGESIKSQMDGINVELYPDMRNYRISTLSDIGSWMSITCSSPGIFFPIFSNSV